MVITKAKTFGPVAPLYRFKTDPEAIKMANDTEFGLAAYFYSRDIGRIWRVAEALEYAIVGINEGIISTEIAPFGGMKERRLGWEGSKYGIEEFLEVKYLCMRGIARLRNRSLGGATPIWRGTGPRMCRCRYRWLEVRRSKSRSQTGPSILS
jgi:succinate-semialdehyde dehydrogenase/glutarate-semialdehyde dehydrogenase